MRDSSVTIASGAAPQPSADPDGQTADDMHLRHLAHASGALPRPSPPALVIAAAVGLLIAVMRLPRVEVQGNSMRPTLLPGDRLVVVPLPARPGRLVVVGDPRHPTRRLVKRVAGADPDGLDVRGDNPGASTDSRHFGPIPPALVHGRPAYRYAPADTAGWVWRA
jgi:nickel-type superoxide dismutase maturation protease